MVLIMKYIYSGTLFKYSLEVDILYLSIYILSYFVLLLYYI